MRRYHERKLILPMLLSHTFTFIMWAIIFLAMFQGTQLILTELKMFILVGISKIFIRMYVKFKYITVQTLYIVFSQKDHLHIKQQQM